MPVIPIGERTHGWHVLGLFRSQNNTFKITARRGSQVLHADRLHEHELADFDPQTWWEAHR